MTATYTEADVKELMQAARRLLSWTPSDGWHFEACTYYDEEEICNCGTAERETDLRKALINLEAIKPAQARDFWIQDFQVGKGGARRVWAMKDEPGESDQEEFAGLIHVREVIQAQGKSNG